MVKASFGKHQLAVQSLALHIRKNSNTRTVNAWQPDTVALLSISAFPAFKSHSTTQVRIDMSEYMEKHSVSRLIGAPPGYVGYDEVKPLVLVFVLCCVLCLRALCLLPSQPPAFVCRVCPGSVPVLMALPLPPSAST